MKSNFNGEQPTSEEYNFQEKSPQFERTHAGDFLASGIPVSSMKTTEIAQLIGSDEVSELEESLVERMIEEIRLRKEDNRQRLEDLDEVEQKISNVRRRRHPPGDEEFGSLDEVLGRVPLERQKPTLTNKLLGLKNKLSGRTCMNTQTISMYAIALSVDTKVSRFRKYGVALSTLLVVILQAAVVTNSIVDFSYPTCTLSPDSCNKGEFCFNFTTLGWAANETKPRCQDCRWFPKVFLNYTGTNYTEENANAICSNQMDNNSNSNSADGNNLTPECQIYDKCKLDMDFNTNFEGHCDIIYDNAGGNNMKMSSFIAVFFLTMIWMVPICRDMEDASVEDIVLEYHNKQVFNGSAEIVLLGLRFRRYLFPFLVTGATLLLLLAEPLTTKDMILNFLAIVVLFEANNVFATFFLSKSGYQRMQKLADEVPVNYQVARGDWFLWIRVQTALCGILLCIFIRIANKLFTNCDDEVQRYVQFYMTNCAAMIGIVIEWLYRVVTPNRDKWPISRRFSLATINVCRTMFAISLCTLLYYGISYGKLIICFFFFSSVYL
uniref:Uncharacterized protein n=1 Tax=Corethron hystrix TaxID=216773 RepID=A0A7S1BJX5_9STRA|mmetsp:Transcript_30137/g.69094  ORF Transcript_30137/g.69094 Transcript_30137/m.69094 type:complete len:550 (+) Transcript_30137:87-1736(+)